jgi:hypothetical protein
LFICAKDLLVEAKAEANDGLSQEEAKRLLAKFNHQAAQ